MAARTAVTDPAAGAAGATVTAVGVGCNKIQHRAVPVATGAAVTTGGHGRATGPGRPGLRVAARTCRTTRATIGGDSRVTAVTPGTAIRGQRITISALTTLTGQARLAGGTTGPTRTGIGTATEEQQEPPVPGVTTGTAGTTGTGVAAVATIGA